MKVRNTFIIFLVSGFWHGASWNFLVWGALNAVYFLPLLLLNKNRSNLDSVAQGRYLPSIKEFLSMLVTFCMTVFAWIFFRAKSISLALSYISGIFSRSIFSAPELTRDASISLALIVIFLLVEWLGREQQYAIARAGLNWPKPVRWALYYGILLAIFYFAGSEQQFIYFQF